jgi:hypothetical protein
MEVVGEWEDPDSCYWDEAVREHLLREIAKGRGVGLGVGIGTFIAI